MTLRLLAGPTVMPAFVALLLAITAARGAQAKNHAGAQGNRRFRQPVGEPAVVGPAQLSKLLTDVGESLRRAGEDGEVVFNQLYAFDKHLERSLVHEIGVLNASGQKLTQIFANDNEKLKSAAIQIRRVASGKTKMDVAAQGQGQVAFLQSRSSTQRLASKAGVFLARANVARYDKAEIARRAKDTSSSLVFSQAALEADRRFLTKVRTHIKAKAELVNEMRLQRAAQLKSVAELVDFLQVKYSVTSSEQAVSFLQQGQAQREASQSPFSAFQAEVEATLKRKGDTHDILLRIKSMLDKANAHGHLEADPSSAEELHAVVSKMGLALRAIDTVQSSTADVMRRCVDQRLRVEDDDKQLRRNIYVMVASSNHSNTAILEAQRSVNAIERKLQVLNKSTLKLNRVNSETRKLLEKQKKDRGTIAAAVRWAMQQAPEVLNSAQSSAATVALLQQLHEQLHANDGSEKHYFSQQAAQTKDFIEYSSAYKNLLAGREMRYNDALSALQLYTNQLTQQIAASRAALADSSDLIGQAAELCHNINAFHAQHERRRAEVSDALHAVLPRLPEVLSGSASSDEEASE